MSITVTTISIIRKPLLRNFTIGKKLSFWFRFIYKYRAALLEKYFIEKMLTEDIYSAIGTYCKLKDYHVEYRGLSMLDM